MIPIIIIIILIVVVNALIWGLPLQTRRRRRVIKQKPFPHTWIPILQQTLPFYSHLPEVLQHCIQGHIQVLIAEKQFIGCQGLHMTEEIKVTIAAQAALLLLNERNHYFSRLASILVYPDAYLAPVVEPIGEYVVTEYQSARIGESSGFTDQIVLSWKAVKRGIANWHDGHNVVLHEFAHQLDQENGPSNGVPLLDKRSDYDHWSTVMTQAYQYLQQQVRQGHKSVVDPYGTTNPAEFFAVATETFFEKSNQLKAHYPDLYALLSQYFAIDPVIVFSKRSLPPHTT